MHQLPSLEPQLFVLHVELDTGEPLVALNAQLMLQLVLQPLHSLLVTVDIN